ncbi:MAG: phage tail protein [Bacteroidota bacterium]
MGLGNYTLPAGTVVAYAGRVVGPDGTHEELGIAEVRKFGWMVCDGTSLDKNQYPALYMALGGLYGEDEATFNLPNYSGYFLRATNVREGKDPDQRDAPEGGAENDPGSTQGFALQAHEHTYTMAQAGTVGSAQSAAATAVPGQQTTGILPETVKTSDNETRPVNIYVHYLIKFI